MPYVYKRYVKAFGCRTAAGLFNLDASLNGFLVNCIPGHLIMRVWILKDDI